MKGWREGEAQQSRAEQSNRTEGRGQPSSLPIGGMKSRLFSQVRSQLFLPQPRAGARTGGSACA